VAPGIRWPELAEMRRRESMGDTVAVGPAPIAPDTPTVRASGEVAIPPAQPPVERPGPKLLGHPVRPDTSAPADTLSAPGE
jgi:hypothetical protein